MRFGVPHSRPSPSPAAGAAAGAAASLSAANDSGLTGSYTFNSSVSADSSDAPTPRGFDAAPLELPGLRVEGEARVDVDDLREGKTTLPLLIAMERATAEQRALLRHAIEHGEQERLQEIEQMRVLFAQLDATRAELVDKLERERARHGGGAHRGERVLGEWYPGA